MVQKAPVRPDAFLYIDKVDKGISWVQNYLKPITLAWSKHNLYGREGS